MPDTKSQVLSYLEENSGVFLSGEVIASDLNISRNSVWKAIESLRRDGFQIEAASRRGYSLSGKADKISLSEISRYLSDDSYSNLITIHDSLDSTNKAAKSMASLDAPHGTVIIATKQTGGTGRRKRSFSSPEGGIYMSIILRPESFFLKNHMLITPFSAICVCKAIEDLTGFTPSIKWMNDLYLNGKKICGILSEAGSDFDTGELEFIVVGIGINFNSDLKDFPTDIRSTIGHLYNKGQETISKNQLIAKIIDMLLSPSAISEKDIIDEYKKRMHMLGTTITIKPSGNEKGAEMISQSNLVYKAKAIDVDANGKLIVELPSGEIKTLSSEDISIKLTQ